MEPPLASAPVCLVCGEPLKAKGGCVACLLRAGLDEARREGTWPPDSLVFGDFEIARRADGSLWELGRGAMGVTYRAVDKVLHRDVALKVIQTPAAADRSRAMRERFLREARSAAALRHPNVAGIFHLSASPEVDHCYFAMELVEGETLEARVRRDGPIKVDLVVEIGIQVTRALTAAAARGLIHRDLKPGNIMLTRSEGESTGVEIKVIDFGLAKAAAEAGAEMDLTHGGFVGTPAFASPEQFESGAVDVRSDIYALGATLWFALTGRAPFSATTIEEMRISRTRTPLPVQQLIARKVPPALISLLRSCLAIDPAERPASARELMEALESCRRNLGEESADRRKGHKLTALIAVAALAAVALFAFQFFRQNTIPAEPNRSAALVPNAPPEKSIAVLPFDNLSKDEENAFFASGVQDEILTNLAKIADLKVISRTSVMNYKSGAGRNLREIAKTLEVSHVVEGSVQRAGGRIRVTAQLIDARTDHHLWAEHYDRDLADVFAIQSEIAQQIAEQLRAKLSPQEKVAIDERPTADLNAYALFSEARAIEVWNDRPEEKLARKIQLLEQAIGRDPTFVLAWCELAKLQTDLGGFVENREAHLTAARKAAENAVQLRPDLGQPHLALAYYYNSNAAEREKAYEELSIARRTLPNDALLFRILSSLAARRNRWGDSLAEMRKAYELDPLNGEIQYHLSATYHYMRLYAEREKLEDEFAAKNGKGDWYYMAYAQIKLDAGDPAAAQSFLAKISTDFSPTQEIWHTRFVTALYLHDYDAASRVLAAIPAKWAEQMFEGARPQSSADGLVARARGDQEKAQAIFAAAREKLAATWPAQPEASDFAKAAVLDAGLGRKDEAINQARRAVELRPIAQDSFAGPGFVSTLAVVYAWTGEPALAIEQLEIIAKIPAGPSYGELRFDPTWDSLRGDPRFEKIVTSLTPKQL